MSNPLEIWGLELPEDGDEGEGVEDGLTAFEDVIDELTTEEVLQLIEDEIGGPDDDEPPDDFIF